MNRLEQVQSALCEWDPKLVKVHVDRSGTVTLSADWNVDVNFGLFRRIADVLGTEDIEVEKEHETFMISEVTADGWDRVTFTAHNVPPDVLAGLREALK